MEASTLVTVYHQCTSDRHNTVCAPPGGEPRAIRVQDSMPKGSNDVVYELHLLPTELTPVEGSEHQFEARWTDAVRRPFQVYTR